MSSPDAELRHFSHPLDSPLFDLEPLQDWPQQLTPGSDAPYLRLVSSEGEMVTVETPRYRFGEPNLPVAPYREHFIHTVQHNPVVVVRSETGSGKSSNLPLYLLEDGAPKIYVTQPRILAARELMERARHNLGEKHAHLAGYLTGNADDSDCPDTAQIVYITEDLLFRIINRGELESDAVVTNDEAHEMGIGTIMLLERIKQLLPANPDMRLVISSATIPVEKFSKYFGDAPVLDLPGRTFPIEDRESPRKVGETMKEYVLSDEGNVLAFEPGIGRMTTTLNVAQSRVRGHTIHPLNGDQSPTEQREALNSDDNQHIVSTRIGETSITPQNKQVVVDSGLSNVGGYEEGVRVLKTVWSSQATMRQRRGRVGRTEPGIYVTAQPASAPPAPTMKQRPEYDPSPIQHSSVASYILELRRAGVNVHDLDFIDKPTPENLRYDETLLRRLGAIPLQEDDDGVTITDIGMAMTNLGLDAPEARMLIEARNYTQTEGGYTDAVRLQVAAAVAVQQVRGMLNNGVGTNRRYQGNGYLKPMSDEASSDMIFELDVFAELYVTQKALLAADTPDAEAKFEQLLFKRDILPNRYYKAVRTFEELCRREEIDPASLQKPTKEQRAQIIACQISGAQELFAKRGKRVYADIRGDRGRILGQHTTMNGVLANLVVGTAFNFRGMNNHGRFEKRMISGGSIVTVEQLVATIPHRISRQSLGYGVNRRGKLVGRHALFFDGDLRFADREGELPPTVETRVALITAMMTGMAPDVLKPSQKIPYRSGTPNADAAIKKWQYAQSIEERSHVKLNISKRHQSLIKRVIAESMQVDKDGNMRVPLDVTDPAQLDALIPKVFVASLVRPSRRRRTYPAIVTSSPDGISIHTAEEETDYIDVTYRGKIAYITIPREYKYTIERQDFAELAKHHEIKIRIANGKYVQIGVAFEKLHTEKELQAERARSRQERAEFIRDGKARNVAKKTARERRDRERREQVAAKIAANVLSKPASSVRDAKRQRRYADRIGQLSSL